MRTAKLNAGNERFTVDMYVQVVIITSNMVIASFYLQRIARAARFFRLYSSNQILNALILF